MKKLGLKISWLIIFLFMALVSCVELIPDPVDPRLPIYSESGKKQSGALIDNIPFVAYPNPFFWGNGSFGSILNKGDTILTFDFGLIEKNNPNVSKSIFFSLEKLTPEDWEEMKKNFGKKFRLDNHDTKGRLSSYANDQVIESIAQSGQITVKYIEDLKVLAGTFGFTAQDSSGKKYEVRYGRFDYFIYRLD